MIRTLLAIGLAAALGGCAGRLTYTGPAVPQAGVHDKTVNQTYDRTWAASIQSFERHGLTVASADKTSGLISLGFSGKPEQYLDCGQVESMVINPRSPARRVYQFPAASGHQVYEQLMRGNLYDVDRRLTLGATVNVMLRPDGRNRTRITVNTQYQLTRTVHIGNLADRHDEPVSDTIAFTTGSRGTFPGVGQATQCIATGQLEREILGMIS